MAVHFNGAKPGHVIGMRSVIARIVVGGADIKCPENFTEGIVLLAVG